MMELYSDFKDYVMKTAPEIANEIKHEPMVFMFHGTEVFQCLIVSNETRTALFELLRKISPQAYIFIGEAKIKKMTEDERMVRDENYPKFASPNDEDPDVLIMMNSPKNGGPAEVWTADIASSELLKDKREIAPWIKTEHLALFAVDRW